MLQGALNLLADHWPWFALAYLACCAFLLALCRAAKLGDEAWERAALEWRESERATRAIALPEIHGYEAPSAISVPTFAGALAGVATNRAGQLQIVPATALPQPRALVLGEGVAELAHRFLQECACTRTRESLLLLLTAFPQENVRACGCVLAKPIDRSFLKRN